MTVEELKTELEKITSGLSSSGFDGIDPAMLENLEKLSVTAGELGMKEGKHLIGNLHTCIKAIQAGKSNADSGSLRLIALDFYLKKLSGSGNIEDL